MRQALMSVARTGPALRSLWGGDGGFRGEAVQGGENREYLGVKDRRRGEQGKFRCRQISR